MTDQHNATTCAKILKRCGFKSVNEAADLADCTPTWLRKLFRTNRRKFNAMAYRAMRKKIKIVLSTAGERNENQ